MKWINAEQQVTVSIYDEEYEEYLDKIMTVEEMLDTYTNEGCPTMYLNPERKNGKWEEKSTFDVDENGEQIIQEWQSARCSVCGKYHTTPYMYYFDVYNFCPNCGADMRGEENGK